MTSRRLLALATTAFLVLGGATLASAADTPTSTSTSTTAAVSSDTGTTATTTTKKHTASAKPALPAALLGTAKSFQTTDNKSVTLEASKGGWFKLEMYKPCAALTGAQSVKVTKSHRLYIGKKYCSIKSFAEATAPDAASDTSAAPSTAPQQ
jgi:hypothetical protein